MGNISSQDGQPSVESSVYHQKYQKSDYESLLYHVVLPRVLPEGYPENFEEHELDLLSRLVETVEKYSDSIPKRTVKFFQSLHRVHMNLNAEKVFIAINALQPGEMFGIFVRRQNTAFMIRVPKIHKTLKKDQTVTVATFPGNVHPKEVYESSNDLEFTYPAQALNVKYSEMMSSPEFAHQLRILYDVLPKEKQNRNYVNTWLTSILSDADTTHADFPTITKKIRDEVIGEREKQESAIASDYFMYSSDYFRRSNFYMAIKVFLQLSLTMELDQDIGRFVYKIIMLRFIAKLCKDMNDQSNCQHLNVDLMTQFMAKIARRIEKLSTMDPDKVSSALIHFRNQSIYEAKNAIHRMRTRLDEQINNLQVTIQKMAQLKPLAHLDFQRDTKFRLTKLQNYIANQNGSQRFNAIDQPNKFNKNYAFDECNRLIYLENTILYKMKFDSKDRDFVTLRNLYVQHATLTENVDTNDPLETSRVLLVRTKLIAMMDKITTETYPLLLDHGSCVDDGLFNILLLPHVIDMEIAFELGNYFVERNERAQYPGLIEQEEISSESFSVRFAMENGEMQLFRRELVQLGQRNVEEMKQKWEADRASVQKIRNQNFNVKCQFTKVVNKNGIEGMKHKKRCKRCVIEGRIQKFRMKQYELPLPEEIQKQNAIVFELLIPKVIASLRDTLHHFTKFAETPTKPKSFKCWTSKDQLNVYKNSVTSLVSLGYKETKKLPQYHVDNPFEKFILRPAKDCFFYATDSKLHPSINMDATKELCTLSVEPGSPYADLQWTLDTTTHTQNQVLARQSECPQNLSIAEFIEFGSLRADGHRLQLRKLYAIIKTEALSFEQLSVLSLILQLMWETGSAGENGFESHDDFEMNDFAFAMIEALDNFIDEQKHNWAHPKKLLLTVFIAMRIFEMNGNEKVAEKLKDLLNKLRAVFIDWMDKIRNVLNEMTNRNQSAEQSLRLSLAIVSISCAMTFFVNSKHEYFDKIFELNPHNGFTAPRIWLLSIVTLKNNIVLNEYIQSQSQSYLRMFVRLVRYTAIHVESKIREMIGSDATDIREFVKEQWPLAATGVFKKTYFPHVWITEVILKKATKYVTIDILTGSFLVNNLPIARLPNLLTANKSFGRVFGNYLFEVQFDGENKFSTVHKYNGATYEFGWENKELKVIEHGDNNNEMVLIPQENFQGDIPELLIENYSHWWRPSDNVIMFRPKKFTDNHFTHSLGLEYILNLNSCHLSQLKTKRDMLDINSESYQTIQSHLSRLEQQKYIHIMIEEENIATIELVRMNLKFKIDGSKQKDDGSFDMISNEYSRMRVSLQQNCETLFGLNHGLLLERIPVENQTTASKLLILPHSSIQSSCNDFHVSANIDLNAELRNPPFHRYEIDDILRQLKPSNSSYSAWFYLAYLHAITSHGEIEPLTGMSGTERALQILQSSFVWSSAPYDGEAIKTLQLIADLSPKRNLEENIQTCIWPENIPKHCAQDSFVFVVRKLIEDSQRLSGLHANDYDVDWTEIYNSELNVRDYFRCLQLKPNLRIFDTFVEHVELRTKAPTIPSINYSVNTRLVSSLYHANGFTVPERLDLKAFLFAKEELNVEVHIESIPTIFTHNVTVDFVDLWIPLYELCRKQLLNRNRFGLIFSLFAHEGENIQAILALQTVYNNHEIFVDIDPPSVSKYFLSAGTYDLQEISNLIRASYSKPKAWTDQNRRAYDETVENEIKRLTDAIHSQWLCNQSVLSVIPSKPALNAEINIMLTIWSNNHKLIEFITKVESALQQLSSTNFSINRNLNGNELKPAIGWKKFEISFETKMNDKSNNFIKIRKEAKEMWFDGKMSNRSVENWWLIYENLVISKENKYLIESGLFPRMVPTLVLPRITSEHTNQELKAVVGALALAIANEQRSNRIQAYECQPQLKPALDRELENEPHYNWSPSEYPEWLLFEIEQNLSIRRIQIEIAKRMIDPPDIKTKHSVMQLNMGEGKTAVIVPIVAANLANGDQACQITVLKSLYATNLNSLRQYMGGMLNRRIYTFPCRRDMPIAEYVPEMISIYEECKTERGVILTLPEYRLSFQLKIYETVKKGDIDNARHFLNVHKWINANVRNILDESDAILHAKYQLIYTIGNQLSLDGGINRWNVAQAVLKRVPYHMKNLLVDFGEEKIEFDRQYIQNGRVYGALKVKYRSDVFTPCRLLDESAYDHLKNRLIEDFLKGEILGITFPETNKSTVNDLRELLSQKQVSSDMFHRAIKDFNTNQREIVMILSGLLRFEVLKLVMMRRWRVNYGVDDKGTRKMAIPFKAKDVAAEMTEFGHPDVAICLTQLSYYYSGLTDQQLLRVFEILRTNQNAIEIYEKWIDSIPYELIEPSIRTYTGINLNEALQRNKLLFPLLRFNMHVIDFWLSSDVFPREAKTFENKLICTAWDLCSDHMKHRVTGFSGTNDTKNILPMPIAQNDLEELEQTNENLRQTLLRPENQAYRKLPPNVSGKAILERLVKEYIPVLLDAGALMLELSNEQMAKEWLELAPPIFDAAIYFDSKDVLQTIDRNGIIAAFDCSVYRDNLSHCLVYLDDVHTRGTDLKFPLGWKACVTLSGDIARDKTVQACMRMRQLGKGHSIAFWASHEADIRIRKTCNLTANDSVTNEHINEFICNNSKRLETQNTVHWAASAHNYTKKLSAHKLHENSTDENGIITLYNKCVDNEFATLENMYGDTAEAFITEISNSKFNNLTEIFKANEGISKFIQDTKVTVFDKLTIQAPAMKRFKHALDEEQEKELEHELEEQQQVQRPSQMVPVTPVFNERLHKLFSIGPTDKLMQQLKSSGDLINLSTSLSNTQIAQLFAKKERPWSDNLYVSRDFIRVLETTSQCCDEFLRPVWWIGGFQMNRKSIWILLSSFECDCLIPTFQASLKSTLLMYRPRTSKFHDNLLHEPRLSITAQNIPLKIDLKSEVEIGAYAGSMYFKTEAEQATFCSFLGLIPRPRTFELNLAFDQGIIKPNGFVSKEHRKHSDCVSRCVGNSRFEKNPVDIIIKLIVARHQFMRRESHVASIVERGVKLEIYGAQDDLLDG